MQDLERIRFRPEIRLLEKLQERFDIENLLRNLDLQDFRPHYEYILTQQVHLTPITAPRLLRIFHEVCETLEFEEAAEIFLRSEYGVDAYAFHSMAVGTPHIISLTSELIRTLSDDELRFVIGHEIGHLIFRHYRLNLLFDLFDEDPELSSFLEMRLRNWTRLAELSADRVGFLAAKQNLEAATGALLKLSVGLDSESLGFDLKAYLKRIRGLEKLDREALYAVFGHPTTPVRIRSLQVYAEAGGFVASDAHMVGIDRSVEALAQFLEFEVVTDLSDLELNFLVAASLQAASAAGEPTAEEREVVVHLLLPFTEDAAKRVKRLSSSEEAQEQLKDSVHRLREKPMEKRHRLYRQLCHVVGAGGRLDLRERAYLRNVAGMLSMAPLAAGKIVYEVVAGFLQRSEAVPMTRLSSFVTTGIEKSRVIKIPSLDSSF